MSKGIAQKPPGGRCSAWWVGPLALIVSSTGGMTAPSGPRWVGRYTSEFSGREGRGTAVLELRSDSTAVMALRYREASRELVQTGKWSTLPYRAAPRVLIAFSRPRKENLILELREGVLVSLVHDKHKYGPGGLRFTSGGSVGGGASASEEGDRWEGTYRRSFTTSRGRTEMVLQLQGNGVAVMRMVYQAGPQPAAQAGTWKVQGDRLTVTLSPPAPWKAKGRPRSEVLVFTRRGSDLVAVDWDREKYGREAFRLLRDPAAPEAWVGIYQRSFTESRGQVKVTLELRSDRRAVMTTAYEGERQPVEQTGTWGVQGDQLTVNLDRQNGRKVRESLVLKWQGGALVAVDWDRQKYGQEAFRFTPVGGSRGGLWGQGK